MSDHIVVDHLTENCAEIACDSHQNFVSLCVTCQLFGNWVN